MYNDNKIIKMYQEFESESSYDVNDIAAKICKKLLDEDVIGSEQEYFSLIYYVFDTCKQYVKSTYQ